MNAVRNYFRIKGTMNDDSDNSSKRLHRHSGGMYQKFLGRYMPLPVSDTRLLAFAEATLSPVKYALFQFCGHTFIGWIGVASPPASLVLLKVGAFGGIILAFFYFALLLRKRSTNRLYDSTSSYVSNLLKEILYSVLAAYLGVKECGPRDEMRLFMLAGALGPIVAAMAVVAFLGLVVGIFWACGKVQGLKRRRLMG